MEQSSITPPPVGGQTPQKKKGGCLKIGLIVMGVFFLIGAISSIFSDDKATESAKSETEAVTDAQKSEDNAPKVDSAMVAKLKPLFKENKDEFKNVTWVEPKSAPSVRNRNGYYTYFCVNNGKPENFRLVIQYAADDWLFIRSYTFLIDGKAYEFSSPNMERDNASGDIWEWSDTQVESNQEVFNIIAAMKDAKEVKIRFNGKQYHTDKTLSQKDIKAIVEPLEYYLALGGK